MTSRPIVAGVLILAAGLVPVLMGPGLFVASVLYGLLAQRTGTILPGMLLHVAGDLARVLFGSLRGGLGGLFVG